LIWKGSVFLPGSPQIWLNHGDSQRAKLRFYIILTCLCYNRTEEVKFYA
jgi:hypothetical protein